MIRVYGLIEWFIATEYNGGEQGAAAEDVVDHSRSGAAGTDIGFAVFVANRIKKVKGAKAYT